MNKVCLTGRLTTDTELRYNTNNKAYIRFNLAVNRNFKNSNGEIEADFISCVAWEKTAELINQYFKKGSQIGIEGRIQTGSYTKDNGEKVYTTDVIIENITFLDSKKSERPEPEKSNEDPFAELGEQLEFDNNFLE